MKQKTLILWEFKSLLQPTKNIFFVVFQLYSPCGEFYAQVRDIAFGSDMRFARWELQGEYNITVSKANNITFAKQKYHADEVSISLKRFTTHNFCDIHAFGVIGTRNQIPTLKFPICS